jgi:hypothetical protein
MDDKSAWVLRVLGVAVTSRGDQAPQDDPLDLKNRLATASRQLDELKAEGAPELPDLLKIFADTQTAVQGKADEAGERMNTLEEQVARARQAAQYRKNSQELAGKVDYAKLLLRWRRAQTVVMTNMQDLASALRGNPEVLNDPDPEEVLDLIDEFPDLIPEFGTALDNVLDACNKPDADVATLREDALEILEDYRAEVEKVLEIKDLEELATKAGIGNFSLFTEFQSAFAELEKELGKQA